MASLILNLEDASYLLDARLLRSLHDQYMLFLESVIKTQMENTYSFDRAPADDHVSLAYVAFDK